VTRPGFRSTRQCKKCPWKKAVNPAEIPGQYDAAKHAHLETCNAETGKLMACHESPIGAEYACVGWLVNQLPTNGQLQTRARLGHFDPSRLKIEGEQHETLAAMCAARKGSAR
jgi:hypothetical protein